MEIKPIEIFSEASNYAIVRMPGRSFPGCVIQGDSLSILLHRAEEVLELAKRSADHELIESAQEIVDSLQGRLDHYAQVLTEHGMQLPFGSGNRM